VIFSIFGNTNYSSLSDESLMLHIANGKSEAFNELYKRYGDKLYRYFLRLLNNNVLAEDFTQDLFIKVMQNAIGFNVEKKFSSWIYTIANNMCRNEWRNKNNREAIFAQISNDTVVKQQLHQQIDKKVLQNKLAIELQKFNEEDQLIIHLRYDQELTIQEIALIIDVPEGTIKSRLFYLMKKLSLKLKVYSPL